MRCLLTQFFREGFSYPPPTGQSPAGPPSEFKRFAFARFGGASRDGEVFR